MAITKEGTAATNEPYPSSDSDHTVTHAGWKITTRKLPILKAGPIEEMTEKLGIAPPEMIFGDNLVRVEHLASGWSIEFNAFDALDLVDKTGDTMLKVSYSKEWQQSRENKYDDADIKGVVKPFDWSYSTPYSGTVSTDSSSASSSPSFAPITTPIPLELLKRPDPILFFDDVMLYEDELADNGMSMLSGKIRVMPARLLLLCRFFMRLDDVVFRIRDTRVFVEFKTGEVIREYTAREEKFEAVRERFAGRRAEDASAAMRDANKLAEYLPVVEQRLEGLVLK
ncbi:TIP41-domain-containing protein [Rhizodiscina lignyota]|uniref:TIP41-domain-containing protein n=1 Tax=Rhizodiscina lignyota TaxID=1504668 RepID=A0A9P4IBM9_9PEZI|nr:TIP41-domain-containing protein [Rhizodiscina lignyota]